MFLINSTTLTTTTINFFIIIFRIGRHKAFLITLIISAASCISPIMTKNFYIFIICRLLAGGILNVYYQLPFVLGMIFGRQMAPNSFIEFYFIFFGIYFIFSVQELSNQSYRTKASCLSAIFYSLGCCAVTFVLRYIRNWISFMWINLITSIIFILSIRY